MLVDHTRSHGKLLPRRIRGVERRGMKKARRMVTDGDRDQPQAATCRLEFWTGV
jgi:hypothetical protein